MIAARRAFSVVFLSAFLLGSQMGGCTITIDPPPPPPNDNSNPPPPPPPPPTTVKIRLVNDAQVTLDPELYISPEGLGDVNQIFDLGNKYTHFGVGGRGLLVARDEALIELDCTAVRTLATRGGLFGEDLNAPVGAGQQRINYLDGSFLCGDTITFRYDGSGMTFTTTVTVSR